jgi:hypothetical protein
MRSVTITRPACTRALLLAGLLAAGVLDACWQLADADAAVAAGGVEVVAPLGPPGDGPLAAVHRALGRMGQGGGELSTDDRVSGIYRASAPRRSLRSGGLAAVPPSPRVQEALDGVQNHTSAVLHGTVPGCSWVEPCQLAGL